MTAFSRRSLMNLLKTIPAQRCLWALLLLVAPAGLKAGEQGNLLSAETGAKGWTFSANGTGADRVQKGTVQDSTAGNALFIRTEAGFPVQGWWAQEVAAQPFVAYTLTLTARGFSAEPAADHEVSVGVFFRSASGEWMDYKKLIPLAYRNEKWPGATLADTKEWKEFKTTIIPPAGCARMGIRLNLSGAPAEAGFAKVSLVRQEESVRAVLDRIPAQIPQLQAPKGPVSAKGITLTPDWSLADAAQWQSATRRKICLNGLWAIQPSDLSGAFRGQAASDWAFVKVPERIRGNAAGLLFGREKTSWAKQDVSKSSAFWLWREITLPEGGEKFSVAFSSLSGIAVRAYWNGKPAGIIEDVWGGRIVLPAEARAGQTGQLAVFALINKVQSTTAHMIASGATPRPYQFEPDQRPWIAEFGDAFLLCEPAAVKMDGVRVRTSVRQHQLQVLLDQESAPEGAQWRLRVKDTEGKPMADLPAQSAREGGRLSLTAPWAQARHWSPDDPYLYSLTVALTGADGKVLDETLPVRFGFREVWVEGKQLMLNGQVLRLRPRMTFFSTGSTNDVASMRVAMKFLKQMGFNCWLRAPAMQSVEEENPLADTFYDLADETGMMLVSYTPYQQVSGGQFDNDKTSEVNKALLDFIDARLMARTVNHPSVIAYSGFGSGIGVKGNPYNANSDWFGVQPLDSEAKIEALQTEGLISKRETELSRNSLAYVRAIKALAPDRPFLSHYDCGMADGWGTFDYFNWTPVQEWESWIRPWAQKGVKPIGSWEHGLPYPMSFVNHAIPDGNGEPLVSEYTAAMLGPEAYALEREDYRNVIRESYRKHKPAYNQGHYSSYWELPGGSNPAGQELWRMQNTRLYRSWRTYGVSMGIEPFGPASNYVKAEWLSKGRAPAPVTNAAQLKTPGIKADSWQYSPRWPNESASSLEPFQTDCLTPLGQALYENNQPLLVYLAGQGDEAAGADFTSKDHVFRSGEVIRKSVAAVWDGFIPRSLKVRLTAGQGGAVFWKQELPLALKAGEIRLVPFEFRVPEVAAARADGELRMEVVDAATGNVVARDSFALQFYGAEPAAQPKKRVMAALVDSTGASAALLRRMGAEVRVVKSPAEAAGCDLLVIGRRALPQLQGQDLRATLPAGMPVLVLEQTDQDLQSAGFHAYPVRTRKVYDLPAKHPVLEGIARADLSDWRVRPTLFPNTTTPLRNGYNWRGDGYATVANVVIETPGRGNFTPLLQCEFDLAMTPLLQAQIGSNRWVFCQLTLEDATTDPVAQRLGGNLLRWLCNTPSADFSKSLQLEGEAGALREALGLPVTNTPTASAQTSVRLVAGEPADAAGLRKWVEEGGTAVVLPLAQEKSYAALSPQLQVATVTTAWDNKTPLQQEPLFAGIGINNLHLRQSMPVREFNGQGTLLVQPAGKGRWVWVGFDPRTLNLKEQPYLQQTFRNQCRVLSQLLTNVGCALPQTAEVLLARLHTPPFSCSVTDTATHWRLRQEPVDNVGAAKGDDWTGLNYQDSGWQKFDPIAKATPYGHSQLRVMVVPPAGATGALLLDAGTVDDFDECYLNGVLVGSTTPRNHPVETAWSRRRIYELPQGLLKPGEPNVIAIRAWNRNAESKGWNAIIRGPIEIRPVQEPQSLYAGAYQHRDDPYFQYHW